MTTNLPSATRVRCFFHLQDACEELRDEVGVEARTLEEARTEALKALTELWHEFPGAERDWNGWQLRCVDESGEVLFHLVLDGVVESAVGGPGRLARRLSASRSVN